MRMQSKYSSKQNNSIRGILLGCVVSLIITIIAAVIVTTLIARERGSENIIQYAPAVTLLTSSMLGVLACIKGSGEQNALAMLLTAGTYYFVLLCIGILFFDSSFQGAGVGVLAVLVGGVVALLLTNRNYKKPKRSKRRYR